MSWKLVWTPAEVDDILDSIAKTTGLPRDQIDAIQEAAHPHRQRDQLLERQWITRLAWASSELLENVTAPAARLYLADPLWVGLHGTLADIWDRYKRLSKYAVFRERSSDALTQAQGEAFATFWTQLDAFRSSFTEDERAAISLMRQVRCHPYQKEWVPAIRSKKIIDRVESRALDTRPTTKDAWAAFDAFLAKYGDDEKATINIAHRIWRPAADLLVAVDAYHVASRRVAQRDKTVRDARVAREAKT
jgi:hypothetical protein